MSCGQEGKLLARAGGSFITLGAERIKEPGSFALKSRRIVRLISDIPLRSHQGEREKNEYSYDGEKH